MLIHHWTVSAFFQKVHLKPTSLSKNFSFYLPPSQLEVNQSPFPAADNPPPVRPPPPLLPPSWKTADLRMGPPVHRVLNLHWSLTSFPYCLSLATNIPLFQLRKILEKLLESKFYCVFLLKILSRWMWRMSALFYFVLLCAKLIDRSIYFCQLYVYIYVYTHIELSYAGNV